VSRHNLKHVDIQEKIEKSLVHTNTITTVHIWSIYVIYTTTTLFVGSLVLFIPIVAWFWIGLVKYKSPKGTQISRRWAIRNYPTHIQLSQTINSKTKPFHNDNNAACYLFFLNWSIQRGVWKQNVFASNSSSKVQIRHRLTSFQSRETIK
jgi:hypothetical protein